MSLTGRTFLCAALWMAPLATTPADAGPSGQETLAASTPAKESLWQAGVVRTPKGQPLEGVTVQATGDPWPNGSTTHTSRSARDGSFRVAFAPGTNRGTIQIVAGAESLLFYQPQVWRPWHPHDLVLYASPKKEVSVPVKDYVDTPARNVRITWRRWLQGEYSPSTLVDWKGEGPVTLPASPSGRVEYWIEAENRVRTRYVQEPFERFQANGLDHFALCAEARLSGTIVFGEGRPSGPVTVYSEQPVRHFGREEYQQLWTTEDGRFDLRVPAGIPLGFYFATEGSDWQWNEVRPLQAAEHRSGLRWEGEFGPELVARVIRPDGTPVVGAQVIGLKSTWNSFRYARPVRKEEAFCTQTNEAGVFRLRGVDTYMATPIMVAESESTVGQDPLRLPELGRAHLQWYRLQALESATQELVWDPVAHSFELVVQNEQGVHLQDFELEWHQTNQVAPDAHSGSFCGFSSHRYDLMKNIVSWDQSRLSLERIRQGLSLPADHFHFEHSGPFPEGRFASDRMPEGQWRLTVSAEGYAPTVLPKVTIPDDRRKTVVLQRPASLRVRLLGDYGKPVAGQKLRLSHPTSSSPYPLPSWTGDASPEDPINPEMRTTNPDGWVAFPSIAPGIHFVTAMGVRRLHWPRQTVELASGESKEYEFQAPPVGSAHVTIDPRLQEAVRGESVFGGATFSLKSVATDQSYSGGYGREGVCFFEELPVGTYTGHYTSRSNHLKTPNLAAPMTVEILEKQTTFATIGLDTQLGTLLAQFTQEGAPLVWGRIAFQSLDTNACYEGSVRHDGHLRIHLPVGQTYQVRAWTRARIWMELGTLRMTEQEQRWQSEVPEDPPTKVYGPQQD